MNVFNLTKSNLDSLVFHVWKPLKYNYRILISLFLILTGFAIQIIWINLFPGLIGVVLGNLFLLNKGFDTRIQKSSYNADAQWTKTTYENLIQVIDLNKKLTKWDKSAFDISNSLGVVIFLFFMAFAIGVSLVNPLINKQASIILFFNLVVLVVPHWVTGIKRISTTPKMVKKIELFYSLIKNCKKELKLHNIEYNVLLKGPDKTLPKDLKIHIKLNNQPEGFLGLYGQMNMNTVEGKVYPYFYVVIVTKTELGILDYFNQIQVPNRLIKEIQQSENSDVIIIRQQTNKNTGYHTNDFSRQTIFKTGIKNAEMLISLSKKTPIISSYRRQAFGDRWLFLHFNQSFTKVKS